MEHMVSVIVSKPSDYKKCKSCGKVNWYEREECVNCPSKEFSKWTEKDAESLSKLITGDHDEGEFCDECEVEV